MGIPAMQLIRMTHANQDKTSIAHNTLVQSTLQYFIELYFFLILVEVPISIALYSNICIHWLVEQSHSITFRVLLFSLPTSMVLLVTWLLGICLVVKYIVIGNYKRLSEKGLVAVDSWVCFRWGISNQFISTASASILHFVDEFWLTAFFWKMMGAKIGKKTKIQPDVLLLEADLIEIGDRCWIEKEVTVLCHKFSNGGLELDYIRIPSNTYIGARAIVLPGSEIIDQNVMIMPLTPIIPGEQVTAGVWQGSPAEKIDQRAAV